MEVLDAARMRRADAIAIDELKLPGLILMENAGRLAAEALLDRIDDAASRPVVVVAGRGNNGGDGFVVARHLRRHGLEVAVYLVGAPCSALSGDAATMAAAWTAGGGTLVELPDPALWATLGPTLGPESIVVDALFGTGLARPLDGALAELVEALNASGATLVALDVPSGLFASESAIPGPAVDAHLTVAFCRPKPAHLLPPAEDLCGELVVVDIGIPDRAVRDTIPDLHWVGADDAAELLPVRDRGDHKGSFGHVLVVGGSVGKAGAAALAGLGALRSGAGLCTVAAPAAVRGEVAACAAELMTEGLPLPKESSRPAATSTSTRIGAWTRHVLALAEERSVLALGPGLGTDPALAAEIRQVVARATVPVVLDADGLNAFGSPTLARQLAKRRAPLVVTPHPGEAARLAGVDAATIQADRLGWARRLAAALDAICILKGYRTIVALPQGMAFINPTGNPGMATGGTGDVLTGLVAGLIAQRLDPLEAAVLGVHLHGLAGDLALEGGETEATLSASSLLAALPRAFRRLAGDDPAPAR